MTPCSVMDLFWTPVVFLSQVVIILLIKQILNRTSNNIVRQSWIWLHMDAFQTLFDLWTHIVTHIPNNVYLYFSFCTHLGSSGIFLWMKVKVAKRRKSYIYLFLGNKTLLRKHSGHKFVSTFAQLECIFAQVIFLLHCDFTFFPNIWSLKIETSVSIF